MQGKRGEQKLFSVQDFGYLRDKGFSVLELPSVFSWPLFSARDSGNVTSLPGSLEVGKEEGCPNGG